MSNFDVLGSNMPKAEDWTSSDRRVRGERRQLVRELRNQTTHYEH